MSPAEQVAGGDMQSKPKWTVAIDLTAKPNISVTDVASCFLACLGVRSSSEEHEQHTVTCFRGAPPRSRMFSVAGLCRVLSTITATQMLYDGSPCFKLGLMAANFAILDATRDYSKIHIVDFDLGQGGQYASLINSIAERSRHRLSPPFVKITAVCDPTFPFNTLITVNNLNIIGDKITRLAERFGITVKFNVLNWRMTELDRSVLGCEPGEALAVNFAFVLSRIADESVSPANPRDQLLRRVKSLEPSVVKKKTVNDYCMFHELEISQLFALSLFAEKM
ncbi:scarecrow-like protein 8 [Asparagus officinalis]|uniref:scarecrow-like protein 8 n=1 Tax=Asparagus officinalis TaxID=4686 RepID=UPI00098E8550|nr:scarecrow-like protein 8 [Asparagus officinalis]